MPILDVALDLKYLDELAARNREGAFKAFYRAAVSTHLPVALWRHPKRRGLGAVVDFSGDVQETRIDFTAQTPGFVFAPFVNQAGRQTRFIAANLYWDGNTHTLLTHPEDDYQAAPFWQHYQARLQESATPPAWETPPADRHLPTITTQPTYLQLVDAAIDYIRRSGVQKVVVSRPVLTPLPADFHPVETFFALCRRYEHAFVSLVSIPGIGTWIGASPELLLSLQQDGLHTVALAGTQARRHDIPLNQVAWGAKEVEEQALVSDYIRQFFTRVGVNNFIETGPRTVSAGSMVHLQTSFAVQANQANLPQLANDILYSLHPTSAVCGMPKAEALSFIRSHESYDRAFYSGFLGPVCLDGQSNLFVNLRCMQLMSHNAVLYVGGGITADSNPQAEWQETVLKSNTLLAVLNP